MSTYNKNDKSDESKESIVQKAFNEILKSPSSYEKVSKETFENVLKEVKKGVIN